MATPDAVLAAALAIALAAAAAAQQDQTVVIRSLRQVAAPRLQSAQIDHASALPDEGRADVPIELDSGGEARSAAAAVHWLQGRVRSFVDQGQLELRPLPSDGPTDRVVLRGARAAVEAAERELDALLAAAARPIEVTMHVLPLPAGPLPEVVLTPAAVQRLLAAAPPHWQVRTRTRNGAGLRLGDARWVQHLRDVDVEVAERAQMDDPKVDLAFAGHRATLSVHELPGDRLLLDGAVLVAALDQLVDLDTGAQGAPTVDAPLLRTAFVSCAGALPSGGALAVAVRGGGEGPDDFLCLLQARFLAPPAAEPGDGALVVPVSAIDHPCPLPDGLPRPYPRPGLDGPLFPGGKARPSAVRPDDLALLLSGAAGTTVDVVDGLLLAQAPAEALAPLRAALPPLFAAASRTVELRAELRRGDRPALQVAQPALLGRPAMCWVGRERAVVADHEVEIAARAGVANPVVRPLRSGLFARLQPEARGSGIAVDGAWLTVAQAPVRARLHHSKPPAQLWLGAARTAVFPWDGELPLDQDHDLGPAPAFAVDAEPARLVVRAHAR